MDEYEKWKFNGQNMVEVLNEFPSLKLSASFLMSQLPKLKPRFYSISSSPKYVSNDIHLTVGVVEYKNKNDQISYGVCSKWLDELEIGKKFQLMSECNLEY